MLIGKYVKLRALEPDDAELLFTWENDFEIWKVSNTLKPFSLSVIKKYIENDHLDIFEIKQQRLMIEKTSGNITIGMIDLFDFDVYNSRAGIGIMIHKNYRENGYAFDTLEIICNYAFELLNVHQLYCNISENNTASIKLFEKAGFVETGTRKDWIFDGNTFQNVVFYQKINPNHIKR